MLFFVVNFYLLGKIPTLTWTSLSFAHRYINFFVQVLQTHQQILINRKGAELLPSPTVTRQLGNSRFHKRQKGRRQKTRNSRFFQSYFVSDFSISHKGSIFKKYLNQSLPISQILFGLIFSLYPMCQQSNQG